MSRIDAIKNELKNINQAQKSLLKNITHYKKIKVFHFASENWV